MANHDKYHNGQFPSNNSNGPFSSFNQEENNEDEIDLKELFYTIWNRKWIVVGSVLICGLLAGIYAFTQTPIYQSNGSMLIEEQQGSGGLGSEGIGQILSSSYGLGAGSTLANELQVFQSRRLSNLIADSLLEQPIMENGRMYPVLFSGGSEDSSITTADTVAARLRNGMSFSQPDREAKVIKIIYETPSPQAAANMINIAMQQYSSLSTRQSRSGAQSAVSFLARERDRIEEQLAQAEEKLRAFMNRTNLVQVDAQTEELITQIAELEGQRQEARSKLQAANSGIEQYKAQLNNIRPGLAQQYADAVGPNLTRLQYQLAELQIEKMQLLAENPELKDTTNPPAELRRLNEQIGTYQQEIKNLTQSVLNENEQYIGFLGGEGMASTVSQLNQKLIELQVQQSQYQAQVEILTELINENQQYFNNLPDNIVELARLKRDLKINEELYTTVSKQYAETALWEQTQFGKGTVIDYGFVPDEPVSPNKPLYVLVGLILGGIFSVGYVLVKDSFNDQIDGVEKLRSFNPPVLTVIPEMSGYKDEQYAGADTTEVQGQHLDTGLVTVLNSISPIAEAYRRLQNNIIYSNPDSRLKSIMVTSSGKGEGKTTTISNLGVTLAEAGYRTIIVDTDLRRPNLHNMFGAGRKPGIAEVLFDDIPLNEVVRETITPGLDVLPAGREVPSPGAITQSRAFLDLIANLEAHFDMVLIDTPPMGIITDAAALIQQADGIIVAARFNETTEPQLSQTLEQLNRLNAAVLGTVLTAFDHTETSDVQYGSSYYKKIYKEYAEYSRG